jgi:hypothetical protein
MRESMPRALLFVAFAGLGCGTAAPRGPAVAGTAGAAAPAAAAPVVMADPARLEAAVGQSVTIRGVVSNTKIPTILGVDVESEAPDLRGSVGSATGILEKRTVTQAAIDREIAAHGQFAHRGPGTFYRLADPRSGRTVQVKPVP